MQSLEGVPGQPGGGSCTGLPVAQHLVSLAQRTEDSEPPFPRPCRRGCVEGVTGQGLRLLLNGKKAWFVTCRPWHDFACVLCHFSRV